MKLPPPPPGLLAAAGLQLPGMPGGPTMPKLPGMPPPPGSLDSEALAQMRRGSENSAPGSLLAFSEFGLEGFEV